jgi:N-methylhydantoinase B
MTVDPIDYAVVSQALLAAAREMGAKLIRSAYSTIVREARDASAALLDRDGNVVAQAELIPMQLGPIGATIGPCLALHPADTLREGDFFINNDPFQGGQHLQDVFIFSPIFFDGKVVGFGATVAHHLDLGGGSPGLNTSATDVYQEGLIFPPSRYNLDRDWNGGALERLVRANIRVPDQTIGDFNAQIAANAIGAARVRQLCEKYGAGTVTAVMRELLDYSERRVRAAIRQAPKGVYFGEDAVDDDGVSDTPLTVRAKVTIGEDGVEVDFDGTCPQVARNLNCPFSSTVSAALSAVKSVLTSPDIPFNEGLKRPIRITAPYGSLLNPKPPAPVRARMEAGYRAYNAVMKALAQVVPDKVIASGFDTTTVGCFARLGERGYRVYLEVFGGGYGAGPANDGADAIDSPLSNCSNTPVEALDMEYDFFRVISYELAPDSFGHGAFRGGAGFSRRYLVLKDNVSFALYADRFRIRPDGLFGGSSGTTGYCRIVRDGQQLDLRSKDAAALQKGDIVELYVGGGGGYGDPRQRARDLVDDDLSDGLLSRQAAALFYQTRSAAE